MELKVTKEKVLEAAKDCKDAERVLKTLFPEAFEDNKYFDLHPLDENTLLFDNDKGRACGFSDGAFMQIRSNGEYAYKGFYLSLFYNWSIVEDSEHLQVLVPTKKEVK